MEVNVLETLVKLLQAEEDEELPEQVSLESYPQSLPTVLMKPKIILNFLKGFHILQEFTERLKACTA